VIAPALLVALAAAASAVDTPPREAAMPEAAAYVARALDAAAQVPVEPAFRSPKWAGVRAAALAKRPASLEEARRVVAQALREAGSIATRVFSPEQLRAFLAELSGAPRAGVGLDELLNLDLDERTAEPTVVAPIPDSPADRAGLLPGDVIVSVDAVPTKGLGLPDVMDLLRGPEGRAVALSVRRGGTVRDVKLVRQAIPPPFPAVTPSTLEVDGRRVGVVSVSRFTESAGGELDAVLEELRKAEGLAAVVLDLRRNPGGHVLAALDVAGRFAGPVPLARLQGVEGPGQELRGVGPVRWDGPLAVLVDGGSASASELVAAGLRDSGRARVVGRRTFGKGWAHALETFDDGSGMLRTIGGVRRLDGREVLLQGVAPDVDVEPTVEAGARAVLPPLGDR
jgi:carboxyl-terminal processing protease